MYSFIRNVCVYVCVCVLAVYACRIKYASLYNVRLHCLGCFRHHRCNQRISQQWQA